MRVILFQLSGTKKMSKLIRLSEDMTYYSLKKWIMLEIIKIGP